MPKGIGYGRSALRDAIAQATRGMGVRPEVLEARKQRELLKNKTLPIRGQHPRKSR